jgi:hypothetical protein
VTYVALANVSTQGTSKKLERFSLLMKVKSNKDQFRSLKLLSCVPHRSCYHLYIKRNSASRSFYPCSYYADIFENGHGGFGTYVDVCEFFTSDDVRNSCCEDDEVDDGDESSSPTPGEEQPKSNFTACTICVDGTLTGNRQVYFFHGEGLRLCVP